SYSTYTHRSLVRRSWTDPTLGAQASGSRASRRHGLDDPQHIVQGEHADRYATVGDQNDVASVLPHGDEQVAESALGADNAKRTHQVGRDRRPARRALDPEHVLDVDEADDPPVGPA